MPNYTPNNKRIAKNSIYMSMRMVIVLCVSLYTTRVVLNMLGVVDFGVYNVVCGFVSMFAFLNISMSNGIQRFFNYEYGKNGEVGANKVYNTGFLIQTILCIIVIILSETIGIWYLQNKMVIPIERMYAARWVFQLSILSFVFLIIKAPYNAAVMAHERLDFFALMSILDVTIKLAILFIIPHLNGDRLIYYGIVYAMISLLDLTAYHLYCKIKFPEIHFNFEIHTDLFKSMLGFSGWNVFGTFSIMMKEQGLSLILNLFFGPVVNAARGIANQVYSGIQGFVANITTPVRPQIVQSYAASNIQHALNLTYSMCKLSCSFYYMMALPVCLEVNFILNLWIGENIPNHAAAFIIITLATSFTSNLHSAISNLVHATGKMKRFQLVSSIIKLSSVVFAFVSLKIGSSAEFALIIVMIVDIIAHIVSCFIVSKITFFPLRKYFDIVIIPIFTIVVLSTFIPLIPRFFMSEGWLRLITTTLCSIISISITLFLWGLNSSEKQMFLNLIQNLRTKIKKNGKTI